MKNAKQPIQWNVPMIETEGDHKGNVVDSYGLTKREYFAGIAMQGILTNTNILKPYKDKADQEKIFLGEVVAKEAVKMAEELLKQLGE